MVTKEQIDRINELARKAKAEGLTAEEIAERNVLRRHWILPSVERSHSASLIWRRFLVWRWRGIAQRPAEQLAPR